MPHLHARRVEVGVEVQPPVPAHQVRWRTAWNALTDSQREWVRANWPSDTPPHRLDVAGVAEALEWMAANVPPA